MPTLDYATYFETHVRPRRPLARVMRLLRALLSL